jgi:hypothetical protein
LVGEATSGRNGIAVYDSNGRQLASLSASADNQPSLTLYDPNTGRASVGLGVAEAGQPALVLFDQDGRDRLELHVNKDGNPGIALANAEGKTVAGLPVREAAENGAQQ